MTANERTGRRLVRGLCAVCDTKRNKYVYYCDKHQQANTDRSRKYKRKKMGIQTETTEVSNVGTHKEIR